MCGTSNIHHWILEQTVPSETGKESSLNRWSSSWQCQLASSCHESTDVDFQFRTLAGFPPRKLMLDGVASAQEQPAAQ
jgi:hypothetical protein